MLTFKHVSAPLRAMYLFSLLLIWCPLGSEFSKVDTSHIDGHYSTLFWWLRNLPQIFPTKIKKKRKLKNSNARTFNTGAMTLYQHQTRVNPNCVIYLIGKTNPLVLRRCKVKYCLAVKLAGNAKGFSFIFHFSLPVSSISFSDFSLPHVP